MKELEIEAKKENLEKVIEFIDVQLEEAECPMKIQMQVDIAVEEIFVNIASYAYTPDVGLANICVDFDEDSRIVKIVFTDSGIPYNPVEKPDPDVTLPAEQRSIGGLGIYMVKKTMDDMQYEYKDGQNILTLTKKI